MKNQRSLSIRQLLTACLLLLLTASLVCLAFFCCGRTRYHSFCKDLYLQEMCSNTINLHYSLASPSAFGIKTYPVVLPCYTAGSEGSEKLYLEDQLNRLRSLPRKVLSDEEQYACSCMERTLEKASALADFRYYSDPLSPAFGMQGQLPILLSEYTFRSRQDVEEYLQLLGQTRDYFRSLLVYEQEKAAAGLLMSLDGLKNVESQCDTIVTLEQLKAKKHFLQTGFRERLGVLCAKESVPKELLQDYLSQNDRLLMQVLLPAYRELKEGLQQLEIFAPAESAGLSALPQGKEYYQILLALQTGSDRTPDQIRALLEELLTRESETIRQLVRDYPVSVTLFREGTFRDLGLEDPLEILTDLRSRMAEDFPALPDTLPDPSVKIVSEGLQDYSAPAFYLTAPIDDTQSNVIYINPKTVPDGLDLYTTLAHEGYPGHLYQNAATAARLLSMKDSRLRQLVSNPGYLEGWALYVEQRSYDYAAALLCEQGRQKEAVCVLLEKHQRSLQLCLYSLLDVKIHYEGASPEEIMRFLEPFGQVDEKTLSSVYSYICQAPCNYLKYYLGYLEILSLKNQARQLWGDDFSEFRFHSFLLDYGPADFGDLRDRLLQRSRSRSSIMLSRYPRSQSRIFSFPAAFTAAEVKY